MIYEQKKTFATEDTEFTEENRAFEFLCELCVLCG